MEISENFSFREISQVMQQEMNICSAASILLIVLYTSTNSGKKKAEITLILFQLFILLT